MISLRPRGEHAALRRAAAKRGGGLIALSPWRLHLREDAEARAALRAALAASHVVFTSPAAVRAARALQPLKQRRDQRVCAVGAGTAAALLVLANAAQGIGLFCRTVALALGALRPPAPRLPLFLRLGCGGFLRTGTQ